jgi:hypothetical protein
VESTENPVYDNGIEPGAPVGRITLLVKVLLRLSKRSEVVLKFFGRVLFDPMLLQKSIDLVVGRNAEK